MNGNVKYVIECLIAGASEWKPLEDFIVRMETRNDHGMPQFYRNSMIRAEQIRELFKSGAHYVMFGCTFPGDEHWTEVHCRLVTIVHLEDGTQAHIVRENKHTDIEIKEKEA